MRKLGIDFWLHRRRTWGPDADRSARPRQARHVGKAARKTLRPVKAGRLAAFARRLARCRLLFGRMRFRSVMQAGHRLRAGALLAEGPAAPGLAHRAAWAMLPAWLDPQFRAFAAPVLRFAQEVWAVSWQPDGGVGAVSAHGVLSPRELSRLLARLSEGQLEGPLAILAAALGHFGLELRSPTGLWRYNALRADLGYCSPAMLGKALAKLRDDDAQAWADQRHGARVDLGALRNVANRATAAERRVLGHLLGGTLRTFERASAQGRCARPSAPPAARSTRPSPLSMPEGAKLSSGDLPCWPDLALTPEPAWQGELRIDDQGGRRLLQRDALSAWSPGREVFTDGSGLHAGSPLALAAGAAVQRVDPDEWPDSCDGAAAGYRVAGRVLPRDVPATSYGGEVMGMFLAAQCLGPESGDVTIV